MSLMFGRLTEDFVTFNTILNYAYHDGQNNQTAIDQIATASAEFKHAAALNASYLVYMGASVSLRSRGSVLTI